MRYRFVDDVRSLELGAAPRIEVVKTFARDDGGLSGPLGRDRVPHSLLLELLAMTGGHLVFRRDGARRVPLLVKVPECRFVGIARPGRSLRAVARLHAMSDVAAGAAMADARAEVFAGDELVAAGRLLYLCVAVPGVDLEAFAGEVSQP